MDITYRPSDWRRPGGRSGPRLLVFAGVFAMVAVLVGAFVLPSGVSDERMEPLPVAGVSDVVYPAKLLSEIEQPVGGQWTMPTDATNAGGATFVLDTGSNRILKLDRSGRIIATLDRATQPKLDLQRPMALTSDGSRLFVANSLAAQVLVLDLSGQVEKVVALKAAEGDTMTPRPIGIAVTPDGGIVVSDADNHRVIKLDDEGRVRWTAGTGARAAGTDGFNVPAAVAVDRAGNVYVVDTLNGRVVRLTADGKFDGEFGRLGDTAGTLSRPKGVAVDVEGRVLVSDGLLAAIQVFAPDGTYLGFVGRRDPTDAASSSLFVAPAGLALRGNELTVTDRLAGLVVLRLSGASSPADAGVQEEGS